jgi:endonuclease YncB( thermonuclease family)
LRFFILLVVFCGIAFAGTIWLLCIPYRATGEPAQPTNQDSPVNPSSPPASSTEQGTAIIGRATVVDGDTIDVGRQRIRLHGIDAPEGGQTCNDADGKRYLCGSKAAFALADFVGETNVRCTPLDRDQYGRIVARCFARETDVAAFLVKSGWALDWPRYSRRAYASEQQDAKNAKRGMWIGKFVEPWNWRACVRNGGPSDRCSLQN